MARARRERIDNEDRSDCETCVQRQADERELIKEAEVKTVGSAFCQECGREFRVTVRVEDTKGDSIFTGFEDDDDFDYA